MQNQTQVFDEVEEIELAPPSPQPQFEFSFRRPRPADIVRSAVPELANATDKQCWLYLLANGYAEEVGPKGTILPPILRLCDRA